MSSDEGFPRNSKWKESEKDCEYSQEVISMVRTRTNTRMRSAGVRYSLRCGSDHPHDQLSRFVGKNHELKHAMNLANKPWWVWTNMGECPVSRGLSLADIISVGVHDVSRLTLASKLAFETRFPSPPGSFDGALLWCYQYLVN